MRLAKQPQRKCKNEEAKPRLPRLDRVVRKSQNVGENKQGRKDTEASRGYHKEGTFEPSTDNSSLIGTPAPSGVRVADSEPAYHADAPYDFAREQNHRSNSALLETVALRG